MNLHLISVSPFAKPSPFQAIPLINSSDTVLFIDDGCYSLHHNEFLQQLAALDVSVVALDEHATLRGITLPKAIQTIGMAQFVACSFDATHIFTWA